MPAIVVTEVTGPWGVVSSFVQTTGLVDVQLLYRLTIAGTVTPVWVTIGAATDELIDTLAWDDNPKVASALEALGYQLP